MLPFDSEWETEKRAVKGCSRSRVGREEGVEISESCWGRLYENEEGVRHRLFESMGSGLYMRGFRRRGICRRRRRCRERCVNLELEMEVRGVMMGSGFICALVGRFDWMGR